MISLQDASKRIDRNADTLRKAAERGTLAARKIGNSWMTTIEEIDRYARENVGKPGPKPKRTDLMIGMEMPITVEDFAGIDWEGIAASIPEKECGEYERVFITKAREAKEAGATGVYAALTAIAAACSLFLRPDENDEPLQPKFVFSSGRSAMVQDFRDDQLAAFSQILDHIVEPELHARIADLLWLRKSDWRAARAAVDSYLASAIAFEHASTHDRHEELAAYDRVHRAYRLGQRIRRVEGVLSHIEQMLQEYDGSIVSVVPLRLMELLLDAKHGDPTQYAALSEQIAKTAEAADDWHGARLYWGCAAEWHARGKDPNARRNALLFAAETHLQDADAAITAPRESFMAAAAHVESAISALERIEGTEQRRAELRARMLEYQKKGMSEMGRISVPMDVTKMVEAAVDLVRGKPFTEALLALAGGMAPPSFMQMRTAVESPEEHMLSMLIPTVMFSAEGLVVNRNPGMISNDAKDTEAGIMAAILQRLRLYHVLQATGAIEPARNQIASEHAATLNDMLPLVTHNPLVPEGREIIIARGLLAGLTGDYLVATHLLMPQIENTLRTAIKQRGINVVAIDNDGIQREFDTTKLLTATEPASMLIKVFGTDLIADLRSILIEPSCGKLRHAMAHGLLDADAFSSAEATYLWWLALHLYCLPNLVALERTSAAGHAG